MVVISTNFSKFHKISQNSNVSCKFHSQNVTFLTFLSYLIYISFIT